ncbi:MAG: Sorting nexin mvp1 [Bathelium mastoideum]|nr:MAG: Sorting nexin mvp1 [Bathelium mastoideum]
MSLFGDEPTSAPSQSKQSLFDDGATTPAAKPGSGLFADDGESGESPWSFPTPKKAARGDLVKTLLPATNVPESYVDAYDALLNSSDRVAGGVGLTGVRRLLQNSHISSEAQQKILSLVVPAGQESTAGLGRGEFNVLVALVGLAQEGEDVTLDSVDERRKNLPQPQLPNLKEPDPPRPSQAESTQEDRPPTTPQFKRANSGAAPPSSSRNMRKQSFGVPEADPWGSPAMHKSHGHADMDGTNAQANGSTNPEPHRTTSTFTTNSIISDSGPASTTMGSSTAIDQSTSSGQEGGWAGSDTGFAVSSLDNEGFGGPASGGDGRTNEATAPRRAALGHRGTSHGAEEVVTITALPEKEGTFLFQHRNYQVASARRSSKVIRRYSDFVWLLDCLHKRYPFRQLPLLPPKRVAINGNHIAADNSFLEKRRRGLVRFANALVRHPVLCQEQLVVMFLTVPTELAVWRKQATISVQEEFVGKSLPPTLEDSLPATLQDTFDTVRSGVRRSAEIYINLCSLLERLAKRNEGIAAEYLRLSLALQTLSEASTDTYAIDKNDVPLLNEGLNATAKHLSASQTLLEDEAKAWDEGVLEDMKTQRDCLVSMRDLFDRRDRYARDNIPQLEKRIQANENKLSAIRAKPEHAQKPGEAEKVEEAIIKDKESIVQQHARGVFIKECIRDELVFFQNSQYHVSRLHQDWSQERVKYTELQADNWRALSEEVEGMPMGD